MKASLLLSIPCVAVLTGCIATTVPDSFRLDEAAKQGLRRANWSVSNVNVSSLYPDENYAIRESVNERLRELSDPALESVPVSVSVSVEDRELEDLNWTILPWLPSGKNWNARTGTT